MLPDDRREQIVRVAVEHLAREGYDRATMSRIAADAGVTRALVYHYFPGKEALLEAVLRREANVLLEATAPSPGLPPRENLVRALNAYLDHFAASKGELRELYTPHPMTPPVVWEIAAANHDTQVARLFDALNLPETPRLRLALGAWLAFVEEAARESATADVNRAEVVQLCLSSLLAATGVRLDLADPSWPDRPVRSDEQNINTSNKETNS